MAGKVLEHVECRRLRVTGVPQRGAGRLCAGDHAPRAGQPAAQPRGGRPFEQHEAHVFGHAAYELGGALLVRGLHRHQRMARANEQLQFFGEVNQHSVFHGSTGHGEKLVSDDGNGAYGADGFAKAFRALRGQLIHGA